MGHGQSFAIQSLTLCFAKCIYDNIPIGRKNRHHISRAIMPPDDLDPPLPTNIPVIGMIRQPGKNKPCNISSIFSALSFLFCAFIDNPAKNVESAIIPYPNRSKLNNRPI